MTADELHAKLTVSGLLAACLLSVLWPMLGERPSFEAFDDAVTALLNGNRALCALWVQT